MIIEVVSTSEIKTNPNNPRFIRDDKFKKLVQSIKDFPKMLEIRPIVVNNEMVVLGGNMRLKACVEAGLKEIPIIKADSLTEEQQKEFIIKDNSSFGQWDWDMVANEWDEQQLEDWGIDLPGFVEEEEDPGGDEKDPFDDEGIEAKNQYGVIVICGNDTEQEAVFEKLSKEGYTCKVVVT